MTKYELACIVGARPNFMKMAPILQALEAHPDLHATLIHTGQHYDANLSDVFFAELNIKPPDKYLDIRGGKQGAQTARMLEALEAVFEDGPQDGTCFHRVLVVGDVNSTMAAAIAAAKIGIPVAHVEAGLRSFDRSMPEEINRIVTDSISDMFFVSEPSGVVHLRAEGHADDQIHLVGNVMIDTLRRMLPMARERGSRAAHGIHDDDYGIVTFHRPSNVDTRSVLEEVINLLLWTAEQLPLVFPVHPRTQSRLEEFGLLDDLKDAGQIHLLPPLGYLDFLSLTAGAKVIITDSGGLQEESTALGVPCLTMRPNTERPITVSVGTSTLVGNNVAQMKSQLVSILDGHYKQGAIPELWDGRAAERIAEILVADAATCR